MRTTSGHHVRAGLPRSMRFGFVLIALGAAVELVRHLTGPPHTLSHHASIGGFIVLAGMLVTVGGLVAQAFHRRPDGPERRD